MDALDLVHHWPVDHVSAGVLGDDVEPTTTGDASRPFRLASLTKPIVGWATLVAVEEGTVALDDPVGQPGCTVRHLLAHAGGYPFEGHEPVANPGRTRMYSNTGFELLGDHLERAAGMPLAEYVRLGVFDALGMTSSHLDGSPAHGATSTVGDLLAFLGELLDPTLVTTAMAQEAFRPQYPELSGIVPGVGRFTPCPWGLGVEIAGDKLPHWTGRARSPATAGHFGGAGTMMWVDPVARRGAVALTDRPFDRWSAEALRGWSEFSDAVIREPGHGGPVG